jgi:hypothetical protein
MAWRNAPSVAAGLGEATTRWPGRSKAGDGTIGNAEHAARQSDHNPNSQGVVHAFDLTHDPDHGVDCERLSAHLVARRDPRVKYIIWNRRICNSKDWIWRPYNGQNPHTRHMHVSILDTPAAEINTTSWWDLDAEAARRPADAAMSPGPQPLPTSGPLAFLSWDPSKTSSTAAATPPPTEPSLPTGPPLAPGQRRPLPPGYGPARPPLPKEVVAKAGELLRQSQYPIGTHIPLAVAGKNYLFAVEWHKHAPTDPVPPRLKDWHRGISVYERKP